MRRTGRCARHVSGRLALVCLSLLIALGSIGIVSGAWVDEVVISGTVSTGTWEEEEELGGTPCFWWWNCVSPWSPYSKAQMIAWMCDIHADSCWLFGDMETILSGEYSSVARARFRAHYLATRLNVESGRLNPDIPRDVTGILGHHRLGLDEPGSATVRQIIDAIEAKCPAESEDGPTWREYRAMRVVCEALNNVEI